MFGALAARISEDKTAIGLTLDQSRLGEALNHRAGRGLAHAEIAGKIGNPCVSFALDKFEDALEVIVLGNGDRFLARSCDGTMRKAPRAVQWLSSLGPTFFDRIYTRLILIVVP